jgi:hypothetical protein
VSNEESRTRNTTNFAVVLEGKVECESGDALRLVTGHDLETLDDAGVGLVLEAAVLALGVLADNDKVDVLVSGRHAGDGLAERDGSIDVELLTHSDVPGRVSAAFDGSVEDA